ncbi:MAG: hypothetical protein EXR72_05695 [Myxococcales bacterium]|nr:hypothetical protein [Myxococcales bacterium]
MPISPPLHDDRLPYRRITERTIEDFDPPETGGLGDDFRDADEPPHPEPPTVVSDLVIASAIATGRAWRAPGLLVRLLR